MENNSIWIERGLNYTNTPGDFITKQKLPKGVYLLNFSPREGFWLEKTSDEFIMDFKIYDMETEFIDYVYKTYENTTRNLGVLLNGTKGTGKTVTAKLICNKLNLPVIMVTAPYDGIADYLGGIKDECVIFFDEFEKVFRGHSNEDSDGPNAGTSLLSVMDGLYTAGGRKVFILTTNNKRIDSNMLNRPSRIRYVKEFSDISEKVVREYCKDNLKNLDFLEEIVEYSKTLEIVTIDIIKSIVEEVNIHNVSIKKVMDFNISTADYSVGYRPFTIRVEPNLELQDVQKLIDLDAAGNIFALMEEIQKRKLCCGYYYDDHDDYDEDGVPQKKRANKIDSLKKQLDASAIAGIKIHYYETDLRYDNMDNNPKEMEVGCWHEALHATSSGYVVKQYDDVSGIEVVYDDDSGALTFIKIYYANPHNEHTYSRYEN